MPLVKRFSNFKIYMYYEDDNPPHIHMVGARWDAKMRIRDQVIFAGAASSRIEKLAADYATDNVAALLALWDDDQ